MSDWQERITRETAPAIRAEHELRYRLAAPLIRAAGAWTDLGCGTGLAAAAALGEARPSAMLLVDLDAEAVQSAAATLAPPQARTLSADLSDPQDLERVGEELLASGGEQVLTCFEVIEHLSSFVPLLEFSTALAREHPVTVLVSVPNDAFWSISNPYHRTTWGEGAFEELRRLLPREHTLARQVAVSGSALVDWDCTTQRHELGVEVGGPGAVATHFLAAFGPRHRELGEVALAVQADVTEQRRWERERESSVAIAQEVVREQSAQIAEQLEKLRANTAEFDAWRTYIHELETELGRPLSGQAPPERERGAHAGPTQQGGDANPPEPVAGLSRAARMRVAFLVNDLQLSGVGVVVQHARQLSEMQGWDVTLVLVREQEEAHWHGYEHLPHLHVRSREQALQERFDVAVATWWETTFTLFEIDAHRYAYFVQSLEDRFYRNDEADRLGAALTLDLPVSFITEARWIRQTLAGLRPEAPCYLVRNGIDKAVFGPLAQAPVNLHEPLRVLVEGSPTAWFKHVREAISAAGAMREPHHLTVVCGERDALGEVAADEVLGPLSHREMAATYERCDVVLKLSSVEGMFGPPLEGFHRGATCVVTPVTGHEEYVEHGWNGLLTDWDDLRGTARQLDLLARDRQLLQFLRMNALETARAWPSWDQASQFMAAALASICREPAPPAQPAAARLLADLRGGIELYHGQLRERMAFAERAMRLDRAIARVRRTLPVRALSSLRRFRLVRLAARPLRPLTRRARRLLGS